jgi:hypothetical protein
VPPIAGYSSDPQRRRILKPPGCAFTMETDPLATSGQFPVATDRFATQSFRLIDVVEDQ